MIRNLFTENDNETWCPVRLFGIGFAVIASTTFLGLAAWTVVVQHQPLDYVAFAKGLALIWPPVSAAIIIKARWAEHPFNQPEKQS